MSVVKLLRVDGDRLSMIGLDCLDGSPLLDIKAYFASTNSVSRALVGLAQAKKGRAGVMKESDAINQGDERLSSLSSAAALSERVNLLREFSPRETGNPEHVRFVKTISEQLASLGLHVHKNSYNFDRWSVPADSLCALTVHGTTAGSLGIPIASTHPYSGCTGPGGITAPLQFVRCVDRWSNCNGKIAVVEVPHPSIPVKLLLDDVGHLPADATVFPDSYSHPVLSATVFGPDLASAKRAGAVGVILAWKGLTAAQAADQYVPFNLSYQNIPALWVADEHRGQVLDIARHGARATLTLDATLSPNAVTDTVWASVEGEIARESVLVATHTDGCNAVEENGALGVLELARMFATGPRPKRTIIFVFVTGHLRIPAVTDHGQAMTAWLSAHPDWWSGKDGGRRAVAGVVIEHLGALERTLARSSDQVQPAVELTYATNAVMRNILETSWAARRKGKVLIAQPNGRIYLGEGEPLYKQGIPAITLVSVPQYLLAVSKTDLVDVELMHEQIGAFARALLMLESMPAHLIGRADQVGVVKKILTGLQLLLVIVRVRWCGLVSTIRRINATA